MRENYKKSIASMKKFPQFTTMNVIDGQAGLIICASLIFYSLTIDNILNIIVLLILAGISIATLTGDNGILTQAQASKENTRGAEVKEKVEMAAVENEIIDYSTGTKKNKQDIINELVAEEKLTDEEVALLETTDIITIGNIEIDFGILVTTIGNVYTEEMIGKTINYTSNTELPEGTEWIILGKDVDGSIMLTTSKPIENGFTLNETVEAWLTYEDDLNNACSIYGATIQEKEVKARSITLKDVNRVTGFIEPEFNTYTFGSTLDFENKKVDYYHPDVTAEYKWSKNETTYECNTYFYYIDPDDNLAKCGYEGNDWGMNGNEEYTTTTLKNMNIIVGDNSDYEYLLASRPIGINPEGVGFIAAGVAEGRVGECFWGHGLGELCDSGSDRCYEGNESYNVSIRPIINLPSNVKLEELNGEWNIIYNE